MSFTRVKPTGWTDDVDPITATQINQLDTNVSRAVDGTNGGAYSPAVAIGFGGAGIAVNNSTVIAYNSRDKVRHFALLASTGSGNWSRANTPRGAWQNTASGGTLDIHLEGLPHGNVLKTLTLRWVGAAGHAAFPGGAPTMPAITLYRIDQDGTETSIATVSDTSATAGAYEAAHDITLASITHTIDRTLYRYVLSVAGETGGNFVANAKAIALIGTVTITSQTEW